MWPHKYVFFFFEILLSIHTMACVPLSVSKGYLPETSKGELAKSHCSRGATSYDAVRYEIDGVSLTVSVRHIDENVMTKLHLVVPEGKIVDVGNVKIVVRDADGIISYESGFETRSDMNRGSPVVTGALVGGTTEIKSQFSNFVYRVHELYTSISTTKISKPEMLIVELPYFSVNNRKQIIPPTSFRYQTYVEWLVPLNC